LKSYCISKCNDQCKEIIEKYQEMECFEELKDPLGELFTNSQKLCWISTGALIGIVAGSVTGSLLIIGLIIVNTMKRKSKAKNSPPKRLANESQLQMTQID